MSQAPRLETEKAWIRLKVLVEKVAELERENAAIQRKIDLQEVGAQVSNQAHADLAFSKEREEQLVVQLENAVAKLGSSEKEIRRLQLQVTELESQLETAGDRLTEYSQTIKELRNANRNLEQTRRDFAELKAIHGECEVSRKVPSKSDEETQTKHLQNIVQKVESQLQSMKMITNTINELSPRSQVAKSNESDAQLQAVMEDFERMKEELERTMSQYEELQQHSEKQKLHWMNKYHRLKESGRVEKTSLEDQLRKLESELLLMKTAITKEKEYKDAMSRRHHEILTEQRSLITRLSEQEELVQERVRQLLLSQMQAAELERDNTSLNQIVDGMNERHNELKKVIRELQAEKQKVEWYKLISANAPNNTVTVLTRSANNENSSSAFDVSS